MSATILQDKRAALQSRIAGYEHSLGQELSEYNKSLGFGTTRVTLETFESLRAIWETRLDEARAEASRIASLTDESPVSDILASRGVHQKPTSPLHPW